MPIKSPLTTEPDFHHLTCEEQRPILLQLAENALQHYQLPQPTRVELVNQSENTTYKITDGEGLSWALRIHRYGYHSKPAIASELAWAMALRAEHVVVTPQPVRGRDGALIQQVFHDRIGPPRHAVLFEWEEGVEPKIEDDLISSFQSLGKAAARMHSHARQWVRPAWFTRFEWNFETSLGEDRPHWGRWRDGLGMDTAEAVIFEHTVAVIGRRLLAYGHSSERYGLLHGDLRLANLLVTDKTLKVIDFDDCGFSWFMYDAATPLSFYEHTPEVPQLIAAWTEGYRRITVLKPQDEAEIPTFVMLRRLLLIAWIGSHSETDLARSLGASYTQASTALCEDYLRRMS